VTIAAEMGWEEEQLGLLRLAGMLHDVGKVAVPDEILRKAGPLTAAEYSAIQRHSRIGADIVARVEGLDVIVPWIRHSHEHFDGSGYRTVSAAARSPWRRASCSSRTPSTP